MDRVVHGRRLSALREPTVTKEYVEDVVEEGTELVYRYWRYIFDFGRRRYRARIYTDEPDGAYVIRFPPGAGSLKPWWRPGSRDPYLRAIHDHLRADTGHPVGILIETPRWWLGAAHRRISFR